MLTFYQFQHPGAADGIAAFASPMAPDGLYRVTMFTLFAKGVTYALAALALFMSGGFLKTAQMERYEYPLLIVFASLGAGMMLSANDLMTLYVGIETLSLSSYVLAAFRRDSLKSAEAGLKYFVLGALASGLLLYGSSLIYGFTGGTGYSVIAAAPVSVGLIFGLVFVICGLAFKASAAPFHIWTPDVYESALTTMQSHKAPPKVAFGTLIETGWITAGAVLTDKKRRIKALVRADGSLAADADTGSIHGLGAKVQGAPSCNGWTYWHIEHEGELKPIDAIRKLYLLATED